MVFWFLYSQTFNLGFFVLFLFFFLPAVNMNCITVLLDGVGIASSDIISDVHSPLKKKIVEGYACEPMQ